MTAFHRDLAQRGLIIVLGDGRFFLINYFLWISAVLSSTSISVLTGTMSIDFCVVSVWLKLGRLGSRSETPGKF